MGQSIPKVYKLKYLVVIDNELTRKIRIDYVYSKLLKFISIFIT